MPGDAARAHQRVPASRNENFTACHGNQSENERDETVLLGRKAAAPAAAMSVAKQSSSDLHLPHGTTHGDGRDANLFEIRHIGAVGPAILCQRRGRVTLKRPVVDFGRFRILDRRGVAATRGTAGAVCVVTSLSCHNGRRPTSTLARRAGALNGGAEQFMDCCLTAVAPQATISGTASW